MELATMKLIQRQLQTIIRSRTTTLRIKSPHSNKWQTASNHLPGKNTVILQKNLSLSMPQSHVPSKSTLTTDLDINRISSLCLPLFEEIHSSHPSFIWAGVFGSVSRCTQRPDSDVDIIVGYTPDAQFKADVCNSMATFFEKLPEMLGVEVDVIAFTQGSVFRYVDMEAMLSAKTIWGDISWAEAIRDTAVDLLQKGYVRMKKAEKMMTDVQRTILSTEAGLMSPEHEGLRISLLQNALSVIHLIKIPDDPFRPHLELTMWKMLANEKSIQAYLEGNVDHGGYEEIWSVLSEKKNKLSLLAMRISAEDTFRRAGLVPPG